MLMVKEKRQNVENELIIVIKEIKGQMKTFER